MCLLSFYWGSFFFSAGKTKNPPQLSNFCWDRNTILSCGATRLDRLCFRFADPLTHTDICWSLLTGNLAPAQILVILSDARLSRSSRSTFPLPSEVHSSLSCPAALSPSATLCLAVNQGLLTLPRRFECIIPLEAKTSQYPICYTLTCPYMDT